MFGSVNILKLVRHAWDLIEILDEFEDSDRKEKSLEKQGWGEQERRDMIYKDSFQHIAISVRTLCRLVGK